MLTDRCDALGKKTIICAQVLKDHKNGAHTSCDGWFLSDFYPFFFCSVMKESPKPSSLQKIRSISYQDSMKG